MISRRKLMSGTFHDAFVRIAVVLIGTRSGGWMW
jgi:hypothetical protein